MSRKPPRESTRPNPAHVTLAVVLQVRGGRLQVLLWQRAREPFLGAWSLPGGYLESGETLEESIRRHLAVKVDVRELAHLEQLATLSDPKRNPLEWELATAYLGLVPADVDPAIPEDTRWHAVSRPPLTARCSGRPTPKVTWSRDAAVRRPSYLQASTRGKGMGFCEERFTAAWW